MTINADKANNRQQIACEVCDLLIHFPKDSKHGDNLHCPRCCHHLSRGQNRDLDTVIALTLTAAMSLSGSLVFIFINFAVSGQERAINLLQTVYGLFDQGYWLLSLIVLLFIVLLPAIYLTGLLLITAPLRWQQAASWNPISRQYRISLGKTLVAIRPWIMAEVFVFGVLVSLIKLIEQSDISLGPAFWCYLLFTATFSYILLILDNQRLWRWIGIY